MLVRYNKKNIYGIMGFRFMPGVNKVDSKKFAEMKTYKAFQFRLGKKILEVVDSEDAASKANDGKSAYAGKSIKQMEALIGEIFDRDLLAQIKTEDERAGVHKAAEAQLEAINLTEAEKKKATEGKDSPD